MPALTERLKIPLPLGNETVNRENYRAALQAVEDNAARITASSVQKRQTVLQGKMDYNTNGADFLSIVSSQLKIKLWAAEVPLICTIADGLGADLREINHVFGFDSDIEEAWILPANKPFLQLYIEYDPTTKEKTFGYTEQETTYEYPAAPVTGQHWFDKDNLWIMQRWDGVTWEKKIRLMVGEAITGASAVTSVICYAIQGKYESGDFLLNTNTTNTINHNIGLVPLQWSLYSKNANGTYNQSAHAYGSILGDFYYGTVLKNISATACDVVRYESLGILGDTDTCKLMLCRGF